MLSDLLKPRLCELGKIKIGGLGEERQKSSGNGTYRMPEKFDHFVVTTMLRDGKDGKGDLIPDTELMESLKEYQSADGKLRQLPISLMSNDLEDVMQAAFVWYNGKRLAAKSDGKTLTRFFDINRGWLAIPETKPWKAEYADMVGPDGKKLFKLHVTLNCVVAAQVARWGGVYKFRSTSQITAEGLYGSLTHVRMLTGGQLRGLPLRLVVRPIQVAPEGKPTTVYVVHAELRGNDLLEIQKLALERAQNEIANAKQLESLQQEYRALLAAPGDRETDEDHAEIAAEFHPEPVADAVVTTAATTAATPTGGQHSAPATLTPDQHEADFINRARMAATESDLDALVAEIKAAFDKGHIRQPNRDRVAATAKARRAEIKATTPAAEPATADSKSG